MLTPLVIGGAFVLLVVLIVLLGEKKISGLRAQGLYPQPGQETNEDVLRLLRSGNKIAAIKCYRTLYGVGLKEAKEAVEALERG